MLLRLVAATAVVFSHSFTLSFGPGTSEPPAPFVPTSFGTIGVAVFFTLSGLLISQSYARRHNLLPFLRARVCRIYPALVVAVLLCALLVGPLFTSLPAGVYYRDPATWSFVLRNGTLRSLAVQSTLPGAFPANPLKAAVDDPLWTLPYEVSMYLLVAAAGVTTVLGRRWLFNGVALLAAVASTVVLWRAPTTWPQAALFARLGVFFLAGATAFVNRDRLPIDGRILLGLAALALALYQTSLFMTAFWASLAYATVVFAYAPRTRFLRRLSPDWDLSYGIYVYGFPCQQVAAALVPGIQPLLLFVTAMAMTMPLAAASWVLIERPALRLKTAGGRVAAAAATAIA